MASTGLPFSSSRNRPTASNRSRPKPSGLIIPWQVMHEAGLVCKATRSRVVRPAWRSGASGATASGGGRSDRPSTLRAMKTPRWIGELVEVYAKFASRYGCVSKPARSLGSSETFWNGASGGNSTP